MVSGIIQGLIALNDESYVPQRWHGTLITIAIIFNAILFNTFLAVKLPLIEGILLGLHVCGVFAIVIPLWVMGPRAPARTALLDYQNLGGWDSMGLAALIGMVTPLNVLIGYDCSVHMCKFCEISRFSVDPVLTFGPIAEEIEESSIVLPRAIMWSVAPNAIIGLLVIVTLAFTSGDVQQLMATPTGEPFIQIFYDVTQSKAAATVMASIVVILLCSCCFSEVATSSRQLWSFARDRGFPASSWLSHVCNHHDFVLHRTRNTNDQTGPTRLEYPCARCDGVLRRSFSTRMHQPRIDHSSPINLVSWCSCHPQFLSGRYRMPHLATSVRGSFATAEMVARQGRTRNQHRGCLLHPSALVLRFLADCHSGDCRDDELGERHLYGSSLDRCGLLPCEG
jgi:hypothetical protein